MTPQKNMVTSETERHCLWSFVPYCVWSFVPYLCKNKYLGGPCRIQGLARRINMKGFLSRHNTRTYLFAIGVHVHLRWCPSTSNEMVFVPVRSGRSVPRKRKKGYYTCFSSFKIHSFSRNALNIVVSHSQSTQINVAHNTAFCPC